jgi:hypothetical protein
MTTIASKKQAEFIPPYSRIDQIPMVGKRFRDRQGRTCTIVGVYGALTDHVGFEVDGEAGVDGAEVIDFLRVWRAA